MASCPKCNRQRPNEQNHEAHKAESVGGKVIIVHDFYGCETGCCGHSLEVLNKDGRELGYYKFDFEHNVDIIRYEAEYLANLLGISWEDQCDHTDSENRTGSERDYCWR